MFLGCITQRVYVGISLRVRTDILSRVERRTFTVRLLGEAVPGDGRRYDLEGVGVDAAV